MQLLLDHGADINAQGGKYSTMLQAAVYRGREDIVQLFLDHRADINAQGNRFSNKL